MKKGTKKATVLVLLALFVCGTVAIGIYQFRPEKRLTRNLKKAMIAYSGGQYGTALTHYESALAIDPTHDLALCELGFVRMALEQPDRALEQFDRCLNLHPKYARAWLGKLRAQTALKNYEQAMVSAQKILEMKRDSDGVLAIADLYAAQETNELALASYKEAAALSPDSFEPVMRSVKLMLKLRRDYEARQELLKYGLREKAKDRDRALMFAADMAIEENQPGEALIYLEKAAAIRHSSEVLIRRAEALIELKDFTRANQDIDAVFKDTPMSTPRAHKIRAACLYEAGKYAEALRDAQIAERGLADDADAALLLARVLYKSGMKSQALEEAQRALNLNADHFEAQNFLLGTLIEQKNYEEVILKGQKLLGRSKRNETALRIIARAYLASGQAAEARKAFEHIRVTNDVPSPAVISGDAALANLDLSQKTIERINAMAERERDTGSNQFLLGQAFLRKRSMGEALRAFERSAQLDPSRVETQFTLAGLNLALNNVEMATERLEKIIKEHPGTVKAMVWLAQLYVQQGKFKQADGLYGRLAELENTSIAALSGQFKARMAQKDSAGALDMAKKLENDPLPERRALAQVVFAVLSYNEKDKQASAQHLDKALEISPLFGPALHLKAISTLHDKKYAEATQLFEKLEKAPIAASSAQHLDYALTLLLSGRVEEARTAAEEEHLLRKSPESLVALVAVLLQAGQKDAAKAQITSMQGLELQLKALSSITEHPKGAVICQKLALADLYARAGRPAWAVQSVEEAMQQAPENTDLAALRANAIIRQGRGAEGTQYLEQIAAKNPQRTDLLIFIAQQKQAQGKVDEAIEYYKKVLEIEPEQSRALTAMGTLLMQRGESQNAVDYLQRALKQQPQDVVSLNNYIWLMSVEMKAPEKALPYAEVLQRAAPSNAHAQDTVGWVYFLNNDFARAEAALAIAAALASENPDIAYHYAMALLGGNKRERALAELKRARSLKMPFAAAADAQKHIDEIENTTLNKGADSEPAVSGKQSAL